MLLSLKLAVWVRLICYFPFSEFFPAAAAEGVAAEQWPVEDERVHLLLQPGTLALCGYSQKQHPLRTAL